MVQSIASAAMGMSRAEFEMQLATTMVKKGLDQMEQDGAALVEMLSQQVVASVPSSQRVDYYI